MGFFAVLRVAAILEHYGITPTSYAYGNTYPPDAGPNGLRRGVVVELGGIEPPSAE